jgi:hypothetical protein
MTRSLLLSDSCGFVDLGRPLWWEDGSFVYNCCWPSPAQSFSGPSPVELVAIFYSLRFETSLFDASYDSQGHGGGIRPCLHTGLSRSVRYFPWSRFCAYWLEHTALNSSLSWKQPICCAGNISIDTHCQGNQPPIRFHYSKVGCCVDSYALYRKLLREALHYNNNKKKWDINILLFTHHIHNTELHTLFDAAILFNYVNLPCK